MELLIIKPGENAQPRIEIARGLGHKEIVVLYTKHDKRNGKMTGTKSAILVTTMNQAKSLKKSYDFIFAPCKREFFESKFVDSILEPEDQKRLDFIHHRNSGLNQVLLKLCQPTAKRPAKRIITTTSLLLHAKSPATLIGRMMQNAKWSKKYKVNYLVTSGARTKWEQRDAESIKALSRILNIGHKA
ncbi:hypothetical protein GOV07_02085 [Candidatus Woesearchaeota archaeon]|nr:hypothetical protein [Candidatus Woesearchaeota archaeon]